MKFKLNQHDYSYFDPFEYTMYSVSADFVILLPEQQSLLYWYRLLKLQVTFVREYFSFFVIVVFCFFNFFILRLLVPKSFLKRSGSVYILKNPPPLNGEGKKETEDNTDYNFKEKNMIGSQPPRRQAFKDTTTQFF